MSGIGGCTRKQISRQHSSRGFWDMQAHWLRNVGDPATSGWHTIDSKKIYRIIQTNTNCGKTATTCSLGPDSTLGEKGEKINLASEGSRTVVWGWERVGSLETLLKCSQSALQQISCHLNINTSSSHHGCQPACIVSLFEKIFEYAEMK